MSHTQPTIYAAPPYRPDQFFTSDGCLWCVGCRWHARIARYPGAPDKATLKALHRCGKPDGGWTK